MFDFDISKLAVIGTVALVVLGPERLPRVARTAGTLLGRAHRYLDTIHAEVNEQIRVDDLRKLRQGVEQAASDIQRTVDHSVRVQASEMSADMQAVVASVKAALPENYLSSIHENPTGSETEIFMVRPPQSPPRTMESAPAHYRLNVAADEQQREPRMPDRKQLHSRRIVHHPRPRVGKIKRTHVVSFAARKALEWV